ncbi:MAG: hypothetical protein QOG52_538, partial [Frankiaceae bacterium]|nr:hypothetical protein [Frankiaceae bacterium]
SVRARRAGYRPSITPRATIVHKVGASSKTRADKLVLLFAGKVTYIDVQWHGLPRSVGKLLVLGGVALRAFAAVVTSNRACGEWRRTWARRAEWREGFPRVTHTVESDSREVTTG